MDSASFLDPIVWWFPHAVLSIVRDGPCQYTWEFVPVDPSRSRLHGIASSPAAAIHDALTLLPIPDAAYTKPLTSCSEETGS